MIGSRTITGINNVNDIGYKDVGGLPNITGSLVSTLNRGTFFGLENEWTHSNCIGIDTITTKWGINGNESSNVLRIRGFNIDASRSSGIYNSDNTEVQPKRILMYYVIKYI